MKEKYSNDLHIWIARYFLAKSILIVTIIFGVFASVLLLIPGKTTIIAFGLSVILVAYFYLRLFIKPPKPSERTRSIAFPSFYTIMQTLLPIIFGVLMLYEGYRGLQLLPVELIPSGLTITFWYTFLTIPLAAYHKYRELREISTIPRRYPSVTVIVPAFNEEKVIARTLEALIEADYPNKEIIVVDDGSTDRTLTIAMSYRDFGVKVFHKENGGKWSAINYGLRFAKGEIIVVVDADSIIGRDALKELVKRFSEPNVVAVCGNVKILNRTNFLTKCQALEYISSLSIYRRALDIARAVPVVPGALGAFRKSALEEVGFYDKDTIVEDFDITIKLLKMGDVVQASSNAFVYTEAPQTLKDLYRQRMRWYRGNFQVILKHPDTFLNPRYGVLQRFTMPYVLSSMIFLPIAGIVVLASAIYSVLIGAWLQVLKLFLIFIALQALMCLLAVEIDEEDRRLVVYSPFFVIGYKHLIDILNLKAFFEVFVFRRRVKWTRATRIGQFAGGEGKKFK